MTSDVVTSRDEASAASRDDKKRDTDANNSNENGLSRAEQAFEAGDYQSVRRLVSELLNSSDPKIVRAARDLKRRVSVDPIQMAVIFLCSALFLIIALTYILR
jgi:hypothetical protein